MFKKIITLVIIILLGMLIYFFVIPASKYGYQEVRQKVKLTAIAPFVEISFDAFSKNNTRDIESKTKRTIDENMTDSSNTEIYYRNLNALFISQNPTIVQMDKIENFGWLGDSEAFYNIVFKNTTPLQANRFKVFLRRDNKDFPHTKTKTSNIFYEDTLSLKGNNEFSYPLITESDISKYFKITKDRILGVGLSPDLPLSIEKNLSGNYSIRCEPILVIYEYETIFKEKISRTQAIYIYVKVK